MYIFLKRKKKENPFEVIMTENFPNLAKGIDIYAQEPQNVPTKMNPKRPTPRHIIIKLPKGKTKKAS